MAFSLINSGRFICTRSRDRGTDLFAPIETVETVHCATGENVSRRMNSVLILMPIRAEDLSFEDTLALTPPSPPGEGDTPSDTSHLCPLRLLSAPPCICFVR